MKLDDKIIFIFVTRINYVNSIAFCAELKEFVSFSIRKSFLSDALLTFVKTSIYITLERVYTRTIHKMQH